jgi:hypothetical protein
VRSAHGGFGLDSFTDMTAENIDRLETLRDTWGRYCSEFTSLEKRWSAFDQCRGTSLIKKHRPLGGGFSLKTAAPSVSTAAP